MSERLSIDAEWKREPEMIWTWQAPTRVSGLEIDGKPHGQLISLEVGGEEQLMAGPVDVADLAQFFPAGALLESPAPGFKIGRLALPSQHAGNSIKLVTVNFNGRMRPFGVQIR